MLADPPHGKRPFRSFWMAGFEGADHVNVHGQALDMVRTSGHADALESDYARLAPFGLQVVRESLGWRVSEPRGKGRFDFDRAHATARAAERRGVQVLWTLMHYGTPPDVTLLDDSFIDRFVDFAAAAARTLRPWQREAPVYTPINEISYLSWGICETSFFHPYVGDRHDPRYRGMPDGFEVKRRLVRASLAAMAAIREEDPRATFLHIDPLVHVVAPLRSGPTAAAEAARFREFQWQAWDMISGRLEPELGGSPAALERLGVNHYATAQWEFAGATLPWPESKGRRLPFGSLLCEAARRYACPIVVAETGHVGVGRARWLREIDAEVNSALAQGVRVEGVCLYPIVDRPDWNDLAHWHRSGLWDASPWPPDTPAPGADRTAAIAPGRHLDVAFAEALQACSLAKDRFLAAV
jgi:beta-glucosidase/6-phospho-beta-glucosidase/beta-galactosidase